MDQSCRDEDDRLARRRVTLCTDAGCSCVPPLTAPADRIATLQRLLASEVEPMVSLTHLLRLCRDEHPTLWEHNADPRCRDRVTTLLTRVVDAMPEPGTASSLGVDARRALSAALTADAAVPPVVVAHALAELLDARYGHGFVDWFRSRSPYQPAVGDPIPLDSPDLRHVTELAPTAPPWRLANRLDETRRVRLAGAWTTQFQVVFDYGLFDVLTGVITADTVLATCHPNHDLAELGLSTEHHEPTFPVEPVDLEDQAQRIDRLLREATDEGASVVVLPELSVTESLAKQLESWVRRPGPLRLLVAGSFHHIDPVDRGQRANRAVAWARGHPAPLIHDKHSPADRPIVEDITPSGWPEVRIHVTADGWHLVIAVCRDLLNPHAVHALSEAGANLVLAPSMSETLLPFGGPVAQLVGSTQAIIAVANNPADWANPDRPDLYNLPGRALFGHPGFAQQTRQVHAPDQRAGVAFLHVGPGRLRWHPSEPDHATHPERPVPIDAAPAWVPLLAQHTTAARQLGNNPVTLRPAAVLVILTAGADGPEVLLTNRAPDLTHYAGQFVFPGGAADAGDRDSIHTALREAREEIGLDPASVHVIGALPALGLPDSAFLVTPILVWSHELRYLHPANPAEVTAVRRVALVPCQTTQPWQAGGEAKSDRAAVDADDATNVGVMTSAIIDLLAAYLATTPTAVNNNEQP
jgi:8-oxo-dGTP pyrophosphatase MutT (NUDIX family)